MDSLKLKIDNIFFVPIRKPQIIDFITSGLFFIAYLIIGCSDARHTQYDDAAITFRYASNIAAGSGFVYNQGDATNGASAPLYALLLALCKLAGADLETAAEIIGIISFGFIGFLTYLIGTRFSGRLGGLIAVTLLLNIPFFREQIGSGMESALACLLGMFAIYLLALRRIVAAGLITGLAIFNKLDATSLFVAVSLAILIYKRDSFFRFILSALAILTPWLVFSTVYFGSPVPFSAQQKLQNLFGESNPLKDPGATYSPYWMFVNIQNSLNLGILLLAILGFSLIVFQLSMLSRKSKSYYLSPTQQMIGMSISLWFLGHFLFFSIVNLGAPYPWYMTVLFAPIALFVGHFVSSLGHITLQSTLLPISALLLLFFCVSIFCVLAFYYEKGNQTLLLLKNGHVVSDYEQFEATRKDAGIYIGSQAKAGEVVETCFGWIAYGALDQPIKETCPLSTRKEVGTPDWSVWIFYPDNMPADYQPPEGWKIDKLFVPRDGGNGMTIVLKRIN